MKKTVVKILSFVCLLVLCSSLVTTGLAIEKCPSYMHNSDNLIDYDPPRYEEQCANLDDEWTGINGNEGKGHIYRKYHIYKCKICKNDIYILDKPEDYIIEPHSWGKRTYSRSLGKDCQKCTRTKCGAERTLNHECNYYKQEVVSRSYSRREMGDSSGHVNIYKLKEKCTACQIIHATTEQREKVPHTIKTTRNQVTPHITYITDTCTVCGYKRTRTVYN